MQTEQKRTAMILYITKFTPFTKSLKSQPIRGVYGINTGACFLNDHSPFITYYLYNIRWDRLYHLKPCLLDKFIIVGCIWRSKHAQNTTFQSDYSIRKSYSLPVQLIYVWLTFTSYTIYYICLVNWKTLFFRLLFSIWLFTFLLFYHDVHEKLSYKVCTCMHAYMTCKVYIMRNSQYINNGCKRYNEKWPFFDIPYSYEC